MGDHNATQMAGQLAMHSAHFVTGIPLYSEQSVS